MIKEDEIIELIKEYKEYNTTVLLYYIIMMCVMILVIVYWLNKLETKKCLAKDEPNPDKVNLIVT